MHPSGTRTMSAALQVILLLASSLRFANGRRRHDGNAALESIARGDGHTLYEPLNNHNDGTNRDMHNYAGRDLAAVDPLPTQKPQGDSSCPCIATSIEELAAAENIVDLDRYEKLIGPLVNLTTYGLSCAPHDMGSEDCLNIDDCANKLPLPVDCDRSWCGRSWCYVDSKNCGVHNSPSLEFDGAHYSYATCGHMDAYTTADRLKKLKDGVLRVAYNANSGGWMGAYNADGSFAVNSNWRGPIVEFVRQAALVGQFTVETTKPPEWLREESRKFFGSSSFDYCVYAASLGYVDLCVAAFTITDKRAGVATFFETSAAPIYVITTQEELQGWEKFKTSLSTIFLPFTWSAWAFMFLFCLPMLGLLMLWHENGRPGSAYPSRVPVLVTDHATGERTEIEQKVPLRKHVWTSLYMSILAFFQESYDQSVVTLGGKVHLLGVSSFIMLILAVYTANLAAILTQDYQAPAIESFEAAIAAGYNFCAERKVMEVVLNNMAQDVDPTKLFVPDPVELGGDGSPGFNCPECNARTRVFDMMRSSHSDPSRHCHAALALMEDLEVLHGKGEHCGKVAVGGVLAFETTGVPIASNMSQSLISLFHNVKNDGVLFKEVSEARPVSTCPAEAAEQEEGTALTIQQLAGIWVVVFSFVLIGVMLKFSHAMGKKMKHEKAGKSTRLLQRYDQWGNATDTDLSSSNDTDENDSLLSKRKTEVQVLEEADSGISSFKEEEAVENDVTSVTHSTIAKGTYVPEEPSGGIWSWLTRRNTPDLA